MAKLDPDLLAKMPKPPADRPRLVPPRPSPEERLAFAEALHRLRGPVNENDEDDEDDGMTDEEFNQAVRDI